MVGYKIIYFLFLIIELYLYLVNKLDIEEQQN